MINFKDRVDRLPSGIIVGSLLVIVAALIFTFVIPAPTASGAAASGKLAVNKLNDEIAADKLQSEQEREEIMPRVWRQGPDIVSASILSQLTHTALADMVVINAFRPQHTTDIGGVTEYPYTVQISGSYTGIHKLLHSLDAQNTKVVLKSAQIQASQVNSNGISATLGISAYLVTDPTLIPQRTKEVKNV